MKQSSEVKKGKDVATVVAPSVATVKNASCVKLLGGLVPPLYVAGSLDSRNSCF